MKVMRPVAQYQIITALEIEINTADIAVELISQLAVQQQLLIKVSSWQQRYGANVQILTILTWYGTIFVVENILKMSFLAAIAEKQVWKGCMLHLL